jgi:hypothetical protein
MSVQNAYLFLLLNKPSDGDEGFIVAAKDMVVFVTVRRTQVDHVSNSLAFQIVHGGPAQYTQSGCTHTTKA